MCYLILVVAFFLLILLVSSFLNPLLISNSRIKPDRLGVSVEKIE